MTCPVSPRGRAFVSPGVTLSILQRFAAAWVLLFALTSAAARSALADCSVPGGLHINEVRHHDRALPDEGYLTASVELFNKGPSPVGLTGYVITSADGTVRATLPSWSLPAGAFLVVRFAGGESDSDFTDNLGTYFTNGDTAGVFRTDADGAALFASVSGGLVDFVGWSSTGLPPSGAAYDSAVADSLWPAGEYVPVDVSETLGTLRLAPDGYDRDRPEDWQHHSWQASNYAADDPGPNALQLAPANSAAISMGLVHFAWDDVAGAVSYRLRVASDSAFTSVVMDTTLTSSSVDLGLSGPVFYWTVQLTDSCGSVATVTEWAFFDVALLPAPSRLPGPTGARRALTVGLCGVTAQYQHKDTRLLCLSNNQLGAGGAPTFSRPGCTEGVSLPGLSAPWDGPHVDAHASVIFHVPAIFHIPARDIEFNCGHCQNYCARASVSMINRFFGGTMSQDRISYEYMQAAAGVRPEGDLGHDRPVTRALTTGILGWALPGANIVPHLETYVPAPGGRWRMVPNAPTMADIKGRVDAGYPLMCGQPGHVFVIDGYCERGTFFANVPPVDLVHKLDPWPTAALQGWVAYNRVPLNAWWEIQRAGAPAVAGRAQEASVTTDSDGDGVMDFDEGGQTHPADRPRLLQSEPNLVDTDGDEVPDKTEIRAYTFHKQDHPAHNPALVDAPGFAIAPNTLRCEATCDMDVDGQFDGGEDINGDGRDPQAGETCEFDKTSKNLLVRTDKLNYDLPEHPMFSGVALHAGSTYTYHIFQKPLNDCGYSIAYNQPYAGAFRTGNVTTDGAGHFGPTDLGLFPEGCYFLYLDILKDVKFGRIVRRPPDVSENCDLTDAFTVRAVTATEVAGPFAEPRDGRVVVRWFLAAGVSAQRLDVERAGSASGPWTRVASFADPSGAAGRQQFEDATLREPGDYFYRIRLQRGEVVESFGPAEVRVAEPPLQLLAIGNPGRGHARLSYSLPRAGAARIAVYDVNGRMVRRLLDGRMPMGRSELAWDGATDAGAKAPAGAYYARLLTAGQARTFKLTLLP